MNFFLFLFAPFVVPYLAALGILKFAFHVQEVKPLTLFGIFCIGGLLGNFFRDIFPFLPQLVFTIMIGVAVYKKYKITQIQAVIFALIIGLLNLGTKQLMTALLFN